MKERGGGKEPTVDERYNQWKSLVPVLYDWLANHNLVWPSLSCRSPLFLSLYVHMYSVCVCVRDSASRVFGAFISDS